MRINNVILYIFQVPNVILFPVNKRNEIRGCQQITFIYVLNRFCLLSKPPPYPLFLMDNGLFQKKSKQRGFRAWSFQGYWRKNMWKLQGSIKIEVEFPEVIKKKPCEISMGLGFWPWNFQEVSQFCKIMSRGKSLFSLEFPTVK